MIFICPIPKKWNEIHQVLDKLWKSKDSQGEHPPIPLVLNGWHYSNDSEKRDRWLKTLAWVKANDCEHLISDLKDEDKYFVNELSNYIPYQYSNWNENPRIKPTDEVVRKCLTKLIDKWHEILNPEFGEATKPIEFTGLKLRRLVVCYKKGYMPPWGSWTNHLAFGSPSRFTELRKSVNVIIYPHEVDHIDFIEE